MGAFSHTMLRACHNYLIWEVNDKQKDFKTSCVSTFGTWGDQRRQKVTEVDFIEKHKLLYKSTICCHVMHFFQQHIETVSQTKAKFYLFCVPQYLSIC